MTQWAWVPPQLSYRGRVLVANNLIASMLWHRFTVLEPPDFLIKKIQRKLMDFFWTGQHWTRAAILYLPLHEGGQGLIDLSSRIRRLQMAQKLLYGSGLAWAGTACVLLRWVEDLGCERHLFVLWLREMDLSGTSAFYRSVLRAWSLALMTNRSEVQFCSLVVEEPLFYNPLIPVTEYPPALSKGRYYKTRRSEEALEHHSGGDQETFSSLPITTEIGDYQEEEGALLSFRTLQLAGFAEVSKKAPYNICVKVLHRTSLDGLKESRWLGLLAPGSSPQGSWRSLYNPPIEKHTGDLQWRILHGAVATNRHVAHINPTIGIPPEASLFQKDSSSPVVCHATGFFPKSVNISWQKNGEDLHEDVELREMLPNQDGTFQKRSVLTVSPEELNRNDYTCIIQHSSLEEEMVLQVSDRRVLSGSGSLGIIIGAVVAALLLVIIVCVGVFIRRKKKPGFRPVPVNSSAPPEGDSSPQTPEVPQLVIETERIPKMGHVKRSSPFSMKSAFIRNAAN
ncbi:hypothetical protein AOLI_G00274870 [Acnodon oligacanthus]